MLVSCQTRVLRIDEMSKDLQNHSDRVNTQQSHRPTCVPGNVLGTLFRAAPSTMSPIWWCRCLQLSKHLKGYLKLCVSDYNYICCYSALPPNRWLLSGWAAQLHVRRLKTRGSWRRVLRPVWSGLGACSGASLSLFVSLSNELKTWNKSHVTSVV